MRRTRETAGVLDGFVGADEDAREDSEEMARMCLCVMCDKQLESVDRYGGKKTGLR